MTLIEFLQAKTNDELLEFSDETGVSYGTLRSIIYSNRKAGMEVFNKLNRYNPHLFTPQFVRPDFIWPQ